MLRTRGPTAALLALSAVWAAGCASGGAERRPIPRRCRPRCWSRVDGERIRRAVPAETWVVGADRATITVPPDVEPGKDVWRR